MNVQFGSLGRLAEPGRLPSGGGAGFGVVASSRLGWISGRGFCPLSLAISSRNS